MYNRRLHLASVHKVDRMNETTLQTAHHEFINHLKAKSRTTSTILAYGKDIEQLIDTVGSNGLTKPVNLTPQDIETFKDKLATESYTPKSISRKINSIKAFCHFLKSQGYLTENPAESISHPKYDVTPPRILSKLEYRALRDACRHDPRMSAIVEVLLQTGIRIGELANLQLDNVNLDKKELVIRPYESHSEHTVPLNRPVLEAIQLYLQIRPKTRDNTLFVTKTGNPFLVRNIRTAVDRYFRLASIKKAKVNDLRHTFIAEQLAGGTPLTYISQLVGHKRLSTTEKYLKLIGNRHEKAEVRLEEL